ncbi:MAG: V-type ATPase 116kDa subunit family protein [Eubacteriales bacterium]|nr:V-type ATPase 116kDa subunit family protein [Eubacteriales bacterium]
MHRLTLVGLTEQKADVLEALMRLGAVEMDELSAQHVALETQPYDERGYLSLNAISRLELAAAYCRHHNPASQHLGTGARLVKPEAFLSVADREHAIMEQLTAMEYLQTQIAEIKTLIAHDRTLQETLAPWRSLKINLAEMMTQETVILIGAFPTAEAVEAFKATIPEDAPETYFELIGADAASFRVLIATLKSRESVVHGNLRQHGFHLLPVQGMDGTPQAILDQIFNRQDDYQRRIERLETELQNLVPMGVDFELLHDFFLLRSDKIDALHHLSSTTSTFYLQGWVPADVADDMGSALQSRFVVAVAHRQPIDGEEPPVLFDNHPLVKPFEVIVEMYAPPSAADIDPTPILAPFFFFFFGMMLADIGYGLVLTGLMGWLAFVKKAEGELGRLARLLFLSGIGAIFFGVLFGGFFGDMLTVLTQGQVVVPSFWFNPMNDPIKMMIWSILFGAVHLFTAMGAKIYMLAKTGHIMDGIFDIAPWYLIIIGGGLLLGGNSILPGLPMAQIGQWMALGGAAVILLFGGRDAKNPIVRLFKGLGALYNITGYFSDLLSYTRILALVLAGSVIAMVINLLGFMLGPTPAGYIMFTLVALFGHTLNLALSVLGAYVHTSRLQYVEFFSKFYEGGGKIFNPLKQRSHFIKFDRTK